MARKCLDCGGELSLWDRVIASDRKLCPRCKEVKKEKVRQYVSKLNEFGHDRYLDRQEEQALAELRASLGLTDEDLKEAKRMLTNLRQLTKKADIAEYEDKLRQVGEDGYLSPQEKAELNALKERLHIADADIAHTYGRLAHLRRLTSLTDGKLPVLTADILLKKGEQCHYEIPCKLIEERSRTRYVGRTQGVSIRIAKGVYYRVGGFKGERVVDTFKEVTDSGTLYITSKRAVFVGTRRNVTYQLNKLVNFVKFPDAIQFQKENEAKPKYFVVENQDCVDEIGVTLSLIMDTYYN